MTPFAALPPFLATVAGDLAVDDDRVTPGLLGFVVVAALGLATWFLIRSMQSRLRKVDVDEDREKQGPGQDGDEPAGPAGGEEPEGRR